MDGVRRTSASRVMPSTPVLVPRQKPAHTTLSTQMGPVGIDGVRRYVPTPRELLEPSSAAAIQIPQVRFTHSYARPAIAFSMILSAVLLSVATGAYFAHAAGSNKVAELSTAKTASTTAQPATNTNTPPPTVNPAAAIAPSTKNASLQSLLDAFVAANGSQYSIYVKDLKTGTLASVNADKVMLSASLYKLFVAQRIYQMVDSGTVTYGHSAGSSSGLNVEDCLTNMIRISDNDCGHDLGSLVGWNKQDAALKNAGYKNTSLGDTAESPQLTNSKDVGLLLEHLYSGTLMSPNAATRFVNLLKDQRVNDRFPAGLPAGTVVAHKTGDLSGYTHDAGIIYGAKTDFVVVIMSGPWPSPETSKPAFGALAGQLNHFFND